MVASSSDTAAPGRPPLRVLVVEDHPDTLAVMLRLLRRLGHAPVAAATCAEALAVAAAAPVDVVLGDIGLPDCDGVELMRRLKAALGCPVWAVSGFAGTADVARCRAAGLDGHLVKPLSADRLRATLDAVVG